MPALVGVSPALLHAGVLPHCFALTLPCLPTRCGVGAKVFARVGQHLLWACLLGGWLGFVFTRGACSCGCLRALVLALWWGGGTVWLRPPLITLTALWRVGFWCSRLWCGRGSACPMGGGRPGRGGTTVSRPYALLVSLPPLRGAWKRKRVGVPARSGEHTHTEGGRRAGWSWRAHSLGAYNPLVA